MCAVYNSVGDLCVCVCVCVSQTANLSTEQWDVLENTHIYEGLIINNASLQRVLPGHFLCPSIKFVNTVQVMLIYTLESQGGLGMSAFYRLLCTKCVRNVNLRKENHNRLGLDKLTNLTLGSTVQ